MISLIVKVDSNNLIGDSQRNCMPWEGVGLSEQITQANRADMKRFVTLRKWSSPDTTPDIVIMWRKTRESIPSKYRPFSQNINYIISRNPQLDLWDNKWEEVQVFLSLESCLTHIREHYPDRDVHVVGGGQIYDYILQHDLIDQIHMTVLDHEFDGDVYFPQLWDEWIEKYREDGDNYRFITYQKK